jgi:hypothetical protein
LSIVHIDIDEVPDDLVALGIEVPEDAGERGVARRALEKTVGAET